jgi:hypothetical protein
MNKNFGSNHYFQMVSVIMLAAFIGFFTTTSSARAATNIFVSLPTDLYTNTGSREDMMAIAERYASYQWQAINGKLSTMKQQSLLMIRKAHS